MHGERSSDRLGSRVRLNILVEVAVIVTGSVCLVPQRQASADALCQDSQFFTAARYRGRCRISGRFHSFGFEVPITVSNRVQYVSKHFGIPSDRRVTAHFAEVDRGRSEYRVFARVVKEILPSRETSAQVNDCAIWPQLIAGHWQLISRVGQRARAHLKPGRCDRSRKPRCELQLRQVEAAPLW
jgi:hypothetical protein